MTTPEQAVQAALDVPVVGGRENYIRSILTAAAPHLAAVRVNSDQIEAARKAVEELANTQMNLPLEDWSRISSAILSALEPSAAQERCRDCDGYNCDDGCAYPEPSAGRAAVLEEAATLLEREACELDGLVDSVAHHLRSKAKTIRALASHPVAAVLEEGDLNARLKAKGMYSIEELMGELPLERWRVHSGMTDLKFFGEWIERKAREYLTMKAAYDVGDKDENDELYEWVLAHYGAFHDVLVNFRAAIAHPVADKPDEAGAQGDGWKPLEQAARNLIANRFDTYKARNGKLCSIEGDDGEKCWIVSFDDMAELEAALPTPPSSEVA